MRNNQSIFAHFVDSSYLSYNLSIVQTVQSIHEKLNKKKRTLPTSDGHSEFIHIQAGLGNL